MFFMPCVLCYASVVEEFTILPMDSETENSIKTFMHLCLPAFLHATLIVLLLCSDLFRIVQGLHQYRNIFG